jgi:protein-tyrosine phosphatase
LHCHILPGLGDGARDIDDSIAMARQGEQDGVEIVCATPHIRGDHAVGIDQIAQRVCLLQGELDAGGVRVSIVPGGETRAERSRPPD